MWQTLHSSPHWRCFCSSLTHLSSCPRWWSFIFVAHANQTCTSRRAAVMDGDDWNVQSTFCINVIIPLFISYFNLAPLWHFSNSSPAQQCLPQSFRLCESFLSTHKEFSFVWADLHREHLCCLPGCWRRRSRCQSCRVSWPRWETPWSFTGERTM